MCVCVCESDCVLFLGTHPRNVNTNIANRSFCTCRECRAKEHAVQRKTHGLLRTQHAAVSLSLCLSLSLFLFASVSLFSHRFFPFLLILPSPFIPDLSPSPSLLKPAFSRVSKMLRRKSRTFLDFFSSCMGRRRGSRSYFTAGSLGFGAGYGCAVDPRPRVVRDMYAEKALGRPLSGTHCSCIVRQPVATIRCFQQFSKAIEERFPFTVTNFGTLGRRLNEKAKAAA